MKDEIVRPDAGLAAVQGLAPGNPLGGSPDVCLAVNYARTFASEFEDDGGEELRRSLHHRLAERRASGEENQIETLAQKIGIDNITIGE